MEEKTIIQIVEKWYKKLFTFDKYDSEFKKLLSRFHTIKKEDLNANKFSDEPQKNFLICLYNCQLLERKYLEKGIPDSILMDTLQDIVIWTNICYEITGKLGFLEIEWIKLHFNMKIFRIGRLQFSMANSDFDIDEISIKKQDDIIGLHVPRGDKLLISQCAKSIDTAKDFFKKYFPDFEYKCFICLSWLLDDTLKLFLKQDSNIMQFQKLFKVIKQEENYDILRFTLRWDVNRENLVNFTPPNNFTQRVKNYVLGGGVFHVGVGYILKD